MKQTKIINNLIGFKTLFLAVLLIVIITMIPVRASEISEKKQGTDNTIYDYNEEAFDSYEEAIGAAVSPVDSVSEDDTIADITHPINGGTGYTTSEAAGEYYRYAMVNRLSSLELLYINAQEWNALYEYYYDLGYRSDDESKDIHKAIATAMYQAIRKEAFKHTGNYIEGDYLLWNFAGATINYKSTENGFLFTIKPSYLSTVEQEKMIDKELDRLLKEEFAGWKNVPDHEKVRMVYTWITKTYSYQQGLENHSTYSGMINHETVCQGFSTSLYRIFGEMGIEVRVIVNSGHGWNIVKLGDYWYNLDSTWDAGQSEERWQFFLPDHHSFTYEDNHVRGAEYDTEEFHASYPMAQKPYNYATERKSVGVDYRTHVQTYGWQEYVYDGMVSGTTGEAKRLEGIEIKLGNTGSYDLGVEYRTHIQSYGWESTWKSNGAMSGTNGQGKRLEAIQIRLKGEDSDKFDIYYRVHAQSYGWLGWAKNGEPSGTAGQGKRLEGIQILILPTGEIPDGLIGYTYIDYGKNSTSTNSSVGLVNYKTHVQSFGWQGYVYDGSISGTSGLYKRLEGINISLGNTGYDGGIRYTTHVQTYGWQGDKDKPESWPKDGAMAGTSGQAKRLEGIRIQLYGEVANHYDVYYRVHAQSFGWLDWASNGADAGTAGLAKRLEAIQIVVLPKGSQPPGSTARPFVQ